VPLLSLWFNENGVIWGFDLGCESESIGQGRSYFNISIDITHCFFSRLSLDIGNGGVIYVDGGDYSINIDYSMFYNCVANHGGGAIYFYSSNSCLRMICANRCSASSSSGHFAYLRASQMNQVEYISVSICHHSTNGYRSIHLVTGAQRADYINSSMNNAFQGSSIYFSAPSTFTSSHCTFSNNVVSNSICIFFSTNSGTISMLYSNIVHNDSPNLGVVYVAGTGSRMMMYCIFHNNQNRLFGVENGFLEVSHSFIDHSELSFSSSRSVSTSTNNSFTNRIIYQIQFFKSYYCNAQLPVPVPSPMRTLFEMQTPVRTFEKSPLRSLEETIMRTNEETMRMTYERTIDLTIRETPKDTIHRSYAECMCTNQMAYNREISYIFAFLYPVIIPTIS